MGTGGIGKTRLALEVAARAEGQVRDGAWLVELDALGDPALIPQAVASALGLRDVPDRALVHSLGVHLRSKQMLLLLDNCEHLLEGCARLAQSLLAACPHLVILATSREPLHVVGEVAWPVSPLCLPELDADVALQELLRCESVQLFVERAQRVFPSFSLTQRNAAAVAQICTGLDGLPLAIELAAAWVKVLSAEQIASRLDDRFRLLSSGARVAPARHQTLQAALNWSYELLSHEERMLFQRLSVFSGTFGLEAVEAVCAGEGLNEAGILELLSQLVDKSLVLVVQEWGRPRRYRLLETVRQFARQQHRSSGEVATMGDRHLAWYLGLAEELEPDLWGTAEAGMLHRLDLEEDNLRAALQWCVSEARAEEGLRLAAALGGYWYVRARLQEGRAWMEQLLALGYSGSSMTRARALSAIGALMVLQQDPEQATPFLEEGLALTREQGHKELEGWLLNSLGQVNLLGGNYARAGQRFAESLLLFQNAGDPAGTATVLLYQGILACHQANYVQAEDLLRQSLPLLRELGDAVGVARGLHGLGVAARHAGEPQRAQDLYMEALQLTWERGARMEIAQAVEGLAGVACDKRQPVRAAHLLGAAAALRDAIGAGLPVGSRADHSYDLESARKELGGSQFEAAWEAGRTMTLEQLRQYLKADAPELESAPGAEKADVDLLRLTPLQAEKLRYEGLTRREREVAALVGQGMSNKAIAEELVVTVRTVEAHVTNILGKLGFSSRTQIAAWAVDRALAPPPETLTDRMSQQ